MNKPPSQLEKLRIAVVLGTRPEAIKLAPVIQSLQANPRVRPVVIVTAQHRHLLDQVLEVFSIVPDHDLDLMRPDQQLAEFAAFALRELARLFERERPAMVVVQGDTTTAVMGALAAFYVGVPVSHVEAGLRSFDKANPFPEEINRRILSQLADLHFAPTGEGRTNLLAESIPESQVFVTGNTAIDALLQVANHVEMHDLDPALAERLKNGFRLVLVTIHRRESFGEPLQGMCQAILQLVRKFTDILVLFPVHPNPNVRSIVHASLGGEERIYLVEPLGYARFVAAMQAAQIILTDSGGVQEEAPTLNKPVLVLRDATERPEVIVGGMARLVGRDPAQVFSAASELLSDPASRAAMTGHANPYGDGHAAERIAREIDRFVADK